MCIRIRATLFTKQYCDFEVSIVSKGKKAMSISVPLNLSEDIGGKSPTDLRFITILELGKAKKCDIN